MLNDIGCQTAGYMQHGGRIAPYGPQSVLSWPRRDVGGLVPGGGGFASLSSDDAAEVNQAMSLLDASPVGAPSTDHATLSVPQPSMGGSGASNGASSSSSSALGAVASLAPLALALLARGGGARGFPRAFSDGGGDQEGGSDDGPSPALGQDPGDLGDLRVQVQSSGASPPVPAGVDMDAAASHGTAAPDAGFPSATGAPRQSFPRLIQGPQTRRRTRRRMASMAGSLTR